MTTNNLTKITKSDNLKTSNELKYTLENPPSIDESSLVITQHFLCNIKSGEIPKLKEYLRKLDGKDWSFLLANNLRTEFIEYLFNKKLVSELSKREFLPRIDWKYVFTCALIREKELLAKIEQLTNVQEKTTNTPNEAREI